MNAAVTSGRASTSTPTRLNAGCPITIAQTIAVTPAAMKALPRRLSPANASRTTLAALAARHRHARDDPVEDRRGGPATHRRLDAREQPVGQHGTGQGVHVVGQHVVAALDRR